MKETMIHHDVTDLALAPEGRLKIEWAERDMPVLNQIKERFAREKPLRGARIAACLHVTSETANLARTLIAGGAEVSLCASNPLSTQDDVAASLVADYSVSVFAKRGIDKEGYYAHIDRSLGIRPTITMDDGADLVSSLHSGREDLIGDIVGGTEETTTGVIRLRAMASKGVLRYPIVAVNDAQTKHFFDNRYGTGQSTMDGILRATNSLIAGKKFVVAGYGWCGRGLAARAHGLGANVIVVEVAPLRALEAVMDGYRVMPIADAAREGDIFVTVTGNYHVIRAEHYPLMKDGAILANSGHFNVELDLDGLAAGSKSTRVARAEVQEYLQPDGRRIYVIADGRLVNLSAAAGHPASVMDMSFANQALSVEYMLVEGKTLERRVYDVPARIDADVARLKLASMGVKIDTLTPEQERYLSSWEMGT
jgi:adenosylhomocysteinase